MRRIFALTLGVVVSFLLAAPTFAQTEEELVNQFLKKAQRQQIKKVGFLVVNGAWGRLNRDNDYNKFTVRVSPLVSSVDGSTVGIDKLNYSQELFGGFGIMVSPKTSATAGFTYWMKLGSTQTGDLNLSLINMENPDPLYDFDLKSQVQVYGFAGQLDYYLTTPPDPNGNLNNLAFKIGAGAGYYVAQWELWDGFTGFNLSTSEQEVVTGKLTGNAPGFSAQVAAEYPVGLGGLVLEGLARYLYLNFTAMRWYNSNSEEVVATINNSGTRVNLNMSGPRIHLGLKRYFGW